MFVTHFLDMTDKTPIISFGDADIINGEATLIAMRLYLTVYMQVRVRVFIISKLAHVRLDVAHKVSVVDRTVGRHIERNGLQLRLVQHAPETEITAYDTGIIRHVLEERIGLERTIRRDRSEGRSESAMQGYIVQMSLRQTAIMDVAETMDRLRQSDRTTVQTRKEILYSHSIRVQVG